MRSGRYGQASLHSMWRWSFSVRHAILIGVLNVVSFGTGLSGTGLYGQDGPTQTAATTEKLRAELVQSREMARLLLSAGRFLDAGNLDEACDILAQLFSEQADSFDLMSDPAITIGIRRQAVDLLKTTTSAARRRWIQVTEPLAEREYAEAVSDRNYGRLLRVAQKYPLTSSALNALVHSARTFHDRGQIRVARRLLKDIQLDYRFNGLPYNANDIVQALDEDLSVVSRANSIAEVTESILPFASPTSSVSLPVFKASWTWEESPWTHPSVGRVLSGSEFNAALQSNGWQPILTANRVIARTPMRIAALDRTNGKLVWSLPTDTLGPMSSGAIQVTASRAFTASEFLSLDRMGTMSTDGRTLYFIDGFRTFGPSSANQRPTVNPRQGLLFSAVEATEPGGTRLVAVTLDEPASVRWTRGSGSDFPYAVSQQAAVRPQDAFTDSGHKHSDSALPGSFDAGNQRFLGVPTVYDGLLYVLSQDDDRTVLNCIAAESGQLYWQQPLVWAVRDAPRRSRLQWEPSADRSSVCGIVNDTVVCVLSTGVIIGVHATDGSLRWATSAFHESSDLVSAETTVEFRPLIQNENLVYAAPHSDHVYCVDAVTGAIQWRVPRAIDARYQKIDSYGLTSSSELVVLIGSTHCRGLRMSDGRQMWLTETDAQTGRGICDSQRCLIPTQNGLITSIDLQTGDADVLSERLMSIGSNRMVGSLVTDDTIICAATPLGISVSGTANSVVDGPAEDSPDAVARPESRLLTAQAMLLRGEIESGLQRLMQLRGIPGVSGPAEEMMAECVLTVLAAGRYLPGARSLAYQELQARPIFREIRDDIPQFRIPVEMKQRWSVLTDRFDAVPELVSGRSQNLQLLQLLPNWHVAADVASASHSEATAISDVVMHDRELHSAESLEWAIRQPSVVGDSATQLKSAMQLVRHQRLAAAESLLLAAIDDAPEGTSGDFRDLLQQTRTRRFVPPHDPNETGVVSPNRFLIEEISTLHIDSPVMNTVTAAVRHQSVPSWCRERFFITRRSNYQQISSVDMDRSAITALLRLPDGVTNIDSLHDDVLSPGLLPITGPEHVGMVSIVGADGPELLWWKRIDGSDLHSGTPTAGFLSADSFVWKTSSSLNCSHPLTGRQMWSRRFVSQDDAGSVLPAFEGLTGDSEVFAISSDGFTSFQLFQTKDGQFLGTETLKSPPADQLITFGRNLLYTDDRNVLRLVDLKTQQDILQFPEDIVTMGSPGAELPNGRAVTRTVQGDILVINLRSGRIETRTPQIGLFRPAGFSGMDAFERDGRIYVLFRDFRRSSLNISASSQTGDMRLESGKLHCLEAATGNLLWTRRSESAVVPEIYGDPLDVIVLWYWQNPGYRFELPQINRAFRDEASQGRERSLTVEVLDGKTGRLLARQRNMNDQPPFRCVHDASSRRLILQTQSSEIHIEYMSIED